MTRSLAHRGPDAEGIHIDGALGLGHRRLSIIDLSQDGHQPMASFDKTIWLVFNGEIYNYRELRAELIRLGHEFHSNSDTEVIIHAYRQWNLDCLCRLNGMFAFALWDGNQKRLWLARDRLGVKPLFYSHGPAGFAFGSEIKAVLPAVSNDSGGVDFQALALFLELNYTPAPFTLFPAVRQLLPGHYLLVDATGRMSDHEYWDICFEEDHSRSERDTVAEFGELLNDAIRLRMRSDVPFGVFLSGGLDSSSVAALMAKQSTTTGPIRTFSVGFGERTYDELDYARQVASWIGSEHRERIVSADCAKVLPEIVRHSEEPTADSSMVAFYYLAQETAKHVKMALSGDGADEILAGYETYQAHYVHRLYRAVPSFIRRTLAAGAVRLMPVSDNKLSLDMKARRFAAAAELDADAAHASWRGIFTPAERASLLAPVRHASGPLHGAVDIYRDMFARVGEAAPLNRMLYVDTKVYLPSDMLVKVDRMSMAHGLEAREPFLDYRLVEYLATVPCHMKLRRFTEKKYLLKKYMTGKLPVAVLRRRKQGFNVPKSRWIKGDLKPFVLESLSNERLNDLGFLDGKMVSAMLSDHFKERADNSYKIWSLLTLSLWQQAFSKFPNSMSNI